MRKVFWGLIFTILALFIIIPIGIISTRTLNSLSSLEILSVLIYPFVSSALASWIVSHLYHTKQSKSASDANEELSSKIHSLSKGRVRCIGTKFNVPNGGEYWSDLFKNARSRFYLIGNTNKSWISRSEEQSDQFSKAIVRLLKSGGEVLIVSNDDIFTINQTKEFIEKRILPSMTRRPEKEQFDRNFSYLTISKSNYSCVVSDDRMVLLPVMNAAEFRDESMVLDTTKYENGEIFKNYIGDIDRLVSKYATVVY
ncbi:hypothetical protein HJ526_04815 [Donghicola sp. C2-DW-16]|uniref:Uncharacterized protein n=1 Tax=Donghicola mangrovi TaxID=2729614 RepID=A0ABX2PC89_9RHOB|nr:hypothetical protein [Donghicola mangrovi]NVO26731.1 hypothetical protein [Donghicola mangrovi]